MSFSTVASEKVSALHVSANGWETNTRYPIVTVEINREKLGVNHETTYL